MNKEAYDLQTFIDKWLICVDPDSHQVYTLNIYTNEARLETDVDPLYREKARKAITLIENLLKLKTGNWLTVSKQIDQYRRRKIPSYLLHKQSNSIATYLCQSTLSLAFSNVNSIKLHVKLNFYENLFMDMSPEAQSIEHPNIIETEAGLVTGADEVIKSVLREVYLRFGVKLKPKDPKNQFILQIAGLKEFLTGNHPMLSYDRVRISLRGMKHLEVILTEIPKQNDLSQMFPPIIIRENKQDITPINWKIYLQVPVLLWYSPQQFPPYDDNRIQQREVSKSLNFIKPPQEIKLNASKFENKQSLPLQFVEDNKNLNQRDLSRQAISPTLQNIYNQNRQRSVSKERMSDLVTLKNEILQRNLFKVDEQVLYSGECDWPFSVRICGIENLMQLFESDMDSIENHKDRATWNGSIPPLYITKQCEEKLQDMPPGSRDDPSKKVAQAQVFLRLTKKYGREQTEDLESFQYKKIAFGGQESSGEIAYMQKKYGLDIIPYLISVQVSIYHGSKLLTSWACAETRKVPFSVSPKFYEKIQFPGIRISMLPQEARLCFNVIVHSCQGETQTIGTTNVYIFDEARKFRSAVNALNIWPFYRADSRLLCMGQYWGLTNSNQKKPETLGELKKFVHEKYSRLVVQMDQFINPMVWSLRDEKQMEELGFSKSAKGGGYYQMKFAQQWAAQRSNNEGLSFYQTYFGNNKKNINRQSESFSGSGEIFGNTGSIDPIVTYKSSSFSSETKIKRNNVGQNMNRQLGNQSIVMGGAYDGYLYGVISQDQGTIRFEGKDERTNHNFGTSMMHLPQGSSIYMHGQNNSSGSASMSFRNTSIPSNNQRDNQTQNQITGNGIEYNCQTGVHPYKNWPTTPRTEDLAILQTLLKVNPLNRPYYTDHHKFILMICRNHYKTLPYALQIFLMAIEWDDPEEVREAHNMIKLWTPLPPEDALPLLDAPFADETVRLYAVERVSILSDDELALYMLELTQGIMFEQHIFNPLAEMLLERSLLNPWVVGHELFWLLRSQLHLKPQYERYALLLEQMLMLCGEFRDELMKEVLLNDELNYIALHVKEFNKTNKDKEACCSFMQKQLSNLQNKLPNIFKQVLDSRDLDAPMKFSFALDLRMEGKDFIINECKVMDSKKLPLWLMVNSNCETYDKKIDKKDDFQNLLGQQQHSQIQLGNSKSVVNINILSKQPPQDDYEIVEINKDDRQLQSTQDLPKNIIQIIFKNGDDIRQDMLTLQLIKIMDKIWLDAGFDFRMKPYKVIATQDQVGMIEVVQSSRTIQKIHQGHGITGAFYNKSIWNYLKNKNTEPQSFEIATDNFLRSCAGYCVATFILGVGDRHSGNIMLTDTGHLFHIDFGHFLGNFKKKFGINRERTKFVLTEEMAFVMGGRDGDHFKKFQSDCTNAYNMVRKHGHFLINIFLMNLSAGMPELQQPHHVKYLEDMLALNISDQEAIARFKQEILTSLNDTWRKIDNFFHNMKRR